MITDYDLGLLWLVPYWNCWAVLLCWFGDCVCYCIALRVHTCYFVLFALDDVFEVLLFVLVVWLMFVIGFRCFGFDLLAEMVVLMAALFLFCGLGGWLCLFDLQGEFVCCVLLSFWFACFVGCFDVPFDWILFMAFNLCLLLMLLIWWVCVCWFFCLIVYLYALLIVMNFV